MGKRVAIVLSRSPPYFPGINLRNFTFEEETKRNSLQYR